MTHELFLLAKYGFALMAHYSGADSLYRWLCGPSLAVLMYHRLRDEYDPAPLSTSPSTFARHVQWLRGKRWLVSLEDGRVHLSTHRRGPRYAITLDDGYKDNLNILAMSPPPPATLYVVTSLIGGTLLWYYRLAHAIQNAGNPVIDLAFLGMDRVDVTNAATHPQLLQRLADRIKSLPPREVESAVDRIFEMAAPTEPLPGAGEMLGWDGISELQTHGIEIGAHTHTHPLLSQTDDAHAREEITVSTSVLRQGLGRRPRHFAYPNGRAQDFGQREVELLRAAGYVTAVTTVERLNRANTDPYRIGRINAFDARFRAPGGGLSKALFFSETSGLLGWLRQWRQ
ncbi:polysaccharide deacetylase family protein [Solilutibacter silvestris]|uniref:Polysaccharide deacetylase n=1 Tax=Solilutibacter silvestris TaxID=1645665 RepID=A0A2K1PZC4_9GAMM|nr:polysaccharide deacetylase family protein [Lysobacter silvestris]PNS08146.1 Polysaccharide deacetylase [Lysobacter silvestris]